MQRPEPFKVICVDDEPDILQLLEAAARHEPDFEVVATSIEATTVIDLIAEHHPDVVIIDDELIASAGSTAGKRGVGSAGLVAIARALVPEATVVVFTGHDVLHDPSHDTGDIWIQKPHLNALWPAIREVRAPTTDDPA
jgi:DNA-binding NarL/FixJ family response regulator